MLSSTLRPIARTALRNARSYSTPRSTSSPMIRNMVLGGSALATVTFLLSQRQEVRLDSKVPRESVLESHSLKESIHKRDGADKEKADAPEVIQTKSVEADETKGPEGAFNEETGEINWDCPCLGGMADGPCGEEFKAAFSCFVYSEAEPKGMDCVEKFKGMQDCFRLHPEIYGEEIDDEEAQPETESGEKADGGLTLSERPVPAAPKKDGPPADNHQVHVSPETTMSKGYTKIKPTNH